MDTEYIQSLRDKLQKRLKRLFVTSWDGGFHQALVQVWSFLQENEMTDGILNELQRRVPEGKADAEGILAGQQQLSGTEQHNAAICYWILKRAANWGALFKEQSRSEDNPIRSVSRTDYLTAMQRRLGAGNIEEALDAFRLAYVKPLFDYIDEQVSERRVTMVLLKKYKQRCEWFHRAQLFTKCKDDSRHGEKILAYDLYGYLHDQGLQFHIEPKSESGRVDLISAQSGGNRLVADAKIFNPERGQDCHYILKGFRQIYDYTKDYNESCGYLVIFKTCENDLSIPTPDQESAMPFITCNNKTIFLAIIDISNYAQPASKRGRLRAYEIPVEEFVKSIPATSPPSG